MMISCLLAPSALSSSQYYEFTQYHALQTSCPKFNTICLNSCIKYFLANCNLQDDRSRSASGGLCTTTFSKTVIGLGLELSRQ